MKEYKITFRNQLDHLRPLFIFTILLYFIVRIFMYIYGAEYWREFTVAALAWYLIFNFVPQMVLHLRYYFLNSGDILGYDPTTRKIIIKTQNSSATFELDEIKLIEYYKSPPSADNRHTIFPFDKYNYNILYFENGDQFVMTSLMVKKFDLPISDNKKKIKKVFYTFPIKGSII